MSMCVKGLRLRRLVLACAVSDTALRQVIRGKLHSDLVTGQNTNVVLAHLSRYMRGYDMPVL